MTSEIVSVADWVADDGVSLLSILFLSECGRMRCRE